MADSEQDIEGSVRILIPIARTGLKYGVHATTHHEAERLMQRYGPEEIKTIREAAKLIEVPIATFIRDTALNMAKAILKKKEQHNDQHEHRARDG